MPKTTLHLAVNSLALPLVQKLGRSRHSHSFSRSRRQLSTHRSEMPFCQGLSNEVRIGLIFKVPTAAGTSTSYFPSRSKIKKRGADSNGNVSRTAAPSIMGDHEETLDYAEGNRRDREELHWIDRKIVEEGARSISFDLADFLRLACRPAKFR